MTAGARLIALETHEYWRSTFFFMAAKHPGAFTNIRDFVRWVSLRAAKYTRHALAERGLLSSTN